LKKNPVVEAEATPNSTQKPCPKRQRKAPAKLNRSSAKKGSKDEAPTPTSGPESGHNAARSMLARIWLEEISDEVRNHFGTPCQEPLWGAHGTAEA